MFRSRADRHVSLGPSAFDYWLQGCRFGWNRSEARALNALLLFATELNDEHVTCRCHRLEVLYNVSREQVSPGQKGFVRAEGEALIIVTRPRGVPPDVGIRSPIDRLEP